MSKGYISCYQKSLKAHESCNSKELIREGSRTYVWMAKTDITARISTLQIVEDYPWTQEAGVPRGLLCDRTVVRTCDVPRVDLGERLRCKLIGGSEMADAVWQARGQVFDSRPLLCYFILCPFLILYLSPSHFLPNVCPITTSHQWPSQCIRHLVFCCGFLAGPLTRWSMNHLNHAHP